jgi:hypothetical protein
LLRLPLPTHLKFKKMCPKKGSENRHCSALETLIFLTAVAVSDKHSSQLPCY